MALAVAVVIIGLSAAWAVEAGTGRHASEARWERSSELQETVSLARDERTLVAANARRSTGQLTIRIDRDRSRLLFLLGDLQENAPAGSEISRLDSRYAGILNLSRLPSHAGQVRAGLTAIASAAARALAADQKAALAPPPRWSAIRIAEAAAVALAAAVGSLGLLWIGLGRPRQQRYSSYDMRVRHLAAQARTDNLTRLGNHRAFQDDLTKLIAQRASTGQPFTLMAIDLDGLKRINDTQGHPAGDTHIRKVADCLQQQVGADGTVYRTGGDEFMIILPGLRNWHGLTLASKIDQATKAAVGRRAVSIGLTESIGMESRHLLVRQADVALYEAKRTKLSAVTFHPGLPGMGDEVHPGEGPTHDQRVLAAALARAVDAKDVGTRSHSETVAQLCVAIGQKLGIEPAELEQLRLAGLLHDVGKIGVADAILQKPEALRPDERSAMIEHVEIGHAILMAAELPVQAIWVLHHHERVDGAGYPEGLKGSSIPVQSRIIAVADAFEAMTGSRPYREAVTIEEALTELQAHIGTQFDGRCVYALVEVIEEAVPEDDLLGIPHGGSTPVLQVPAPAPATGGA